MNENESESINLSQNYETEPVQKRKWTLYLIFCCLTVTTCGSFSYGFNIGSLNSPTKFLIEFIQTETFLFKDYYSELNEFNQNEINLIGNETKFGNALKDINNTRSEYAACKLWGDEGCVHRILERKKMKEQEIYSRYNMTIDEYLRFINQTLILKRATLEVYRVKLNENKLRVISQTQLIWAVINCAFVVGGMLGGFSSKYIMDWIGRKNSVLFSILFIVIGSILVLISPFLKSPICVLVSRFFYGIQGGMACTLVPTYLSEIAPSELRGQIGVLHQLFVTIGILVAQILGLRLILGGKYLWNILLAFPIVPSIISGFIFLVFFKETPKVLLIKHDKLSAARKVLQLLRNDKNVQTDLNEIHCEKNIGLGSKSLIRLKELFTQKELRWPLITALVLQIAQQLSGINAVFFYSSSIFKDAGIVDDQIQYAILSTGLVNVITTIICVPLIDRLGRKPLLVYPMAAMAFDFILLTIFLAFQKSNPIFSYLSILCVMIFVISFAIGLGPIPFIYATECFRQNARSSAISLCVFTNYSAALILTLIFPFMQHFLHQYVFLVFLAVVAFGLFVIIKKVPETKGKNVEDIIESFQN